MKKKVFLFCCLSVFIFSCKQEKEKQVATETLQKQENSLAQEENKGTALLDKCIKAHGGLDTWKSFEGLEYNLDDNGKKDVYQLTNLKDRRAYLKSKKFEVGFDGKVAWSLPNADHISGKSAAFYYNLDFYFLGVPFLLKDPGVNASYEGKANVKGQTYETLKITFGSGVGFSPDDVYYLYIDPETYLLQILTYSVSFIDKENLGIKTAKVYSDYREVQGLMMPYKMENFDWAEGKIGNKTLHVRIFSDIKFLKEIPNEERFEIPDGAVVEALK